MLILYPSRYKRDGTETFLLVYSFKLPPPPGTPSYPRGRAVFLFFNWLHKLLLLDKRRWIQLAEDGGVWWFCLPCSFKRNLKSCPSSTVFLVCFLKILAKKSSGSRLGRTRITKQSMPLQMFFLKRHWLFCYVLIEYQSLSLNPDAFANIAASVRRAAKNASALNTSIMKGNSNCTDSMNDASERIHAYTPRSR